MPIEIGVVLPTSTPDPAQPMLGDVQASARFAEEAGLDSIWSTDHLVASAPILDSTVVLAAAAAATDRIRVGFNVMLVALRRPAWAAKQIGTVQYVSGNRLTLGVGTGNPAHGDIGWRAAGVPYAERGRLTDEALRVIPGLVTGAPTTLDDGSEVTLAPGAVMPPLLVAGNGDRARRRAAAFGDGWISLGLSSSDVAAGVAELEELAAQHGRPAPKATVVAPTSTDDPERAAEQLSAYVDAGTERAIFAPTSPDWKRDYEFAAEVRSKLKSLRSIRPR